MKRAFLNAITLFFACSMITCSGSNLPSNPNTVVTSDYYGVRERTVGEGWNHPEDLEIALGSDSRPIIVIFSATWCNPCKILKNVVMERGWRDKLIILDVDIPENEARSILLNAHKAVPSMVFIAKTDKNNFVLSGLPDIYNFLDEYFLKEVK